MRRILSVAKPWLVELSGLSENQRVAVSMNSGAGRFQDIPLESLPALFFRGDVACC